MLRCLSSGKYDSDEYHPLFVERITRFLHRGSSLLAFASFLLVVFTASCRSDSDAQRVRPRQLRDVPSQRLAFTFSADVDAPPNAATEDAKSLPAIQQDFDTRRKDDSLILLRTITSPDNQRALALYNTADESSTTFHIDLYSANGNFLRNVTPPDLAVVFQDSVAWAPDGNYIAFVGRRVAQPMASPTPEEIEPAVPTESPVPSPTPMPAFAPVATFATEQIYICNRDGYDLRPLTTRDGLIYFALSWAPDGHALTALACKESEWNAREKEFKAPEGRPRVISLDGQERLLDDQMADAPPIWSPDSSKVATAFGVDIGVYDAGGKTPTQARITLREKLLTASAVFDEKLSSAKNKNESRMNNGAVSNSQSISTIPASFNSIMRLEWPTPEKLYAQTGYIDLRNALPTFSRWHLLTLSPQAAVMRRS